LKHWSQRSGIGSTKNPLTVRQDLAQPSLFQFFGTPGVATPRLTSQMFPQGTGGQGNNNDRQTQ
jgi:hypothetical protein